jgi:hypothetical protein
VLDGGRSTFLSAAVTVLAVAVCHEISQQELSRVDAVGCEPFQKNPTVAFLTLK